jgi:polar amino acid transport system substrate-binding protein
MKNLYRYLFSLSLLFCSVFAYTENPIVIATNDYTPYTSTKNDGSGVILEIIRQAFNEVDLEVDYQFYPWKRCLGEVDKGLVFAATPYFKTDARQKVYDYSDPILPMFNRWFYNKEKFPDGFEWSEMESFQGYRIGGVIGYWYIPEFERLGLNFELVKSDLQNLQKLVNHRIDFTIIDELTGNDLIREHLSTNAGNIGILEKPYDFQESYLLISRDYPNSEVIKKKFNQGLKMLKDNGKFWQILISHEVPEDFNQNK